MFKNMKNIAIPQVYGKTKTRLLIMEYMNGVHMNKI